MNALEIIKNKMKYNEPVSKIELAIFNNLQNIPFPETAYDAANEHIELLQELAAYKQGNSDMKLIIQQFQNLLMVNTTTDALAKTAILMREETEAERLLSKALGHLRTCSDPEGDDLYDEIAAAFGE